LRRCHHHDYLSRLSFNVGSFAIRHFFSSRKLE
jgi:hypothetical protein